MKKHFLYGFLGLLIFIPGSLAWADSIASQAAPWIRIPDTTRQAALGGSAGALLGDVDALDVNPAGLADLRTDEIAFTQAFWVQGLSVEHLVYGHSFGDFTFALGGDYLDFGAVDQYTLNGSGLPSPNGTYSPTSLDLQAGAGVKLGELFEVGLSARTLYQSLSATDQAWGLAVDLGLLYLNQPGGFRAGLAIQNLGTSLDGASLPLVADLSGAFTRVLSEGHRVSLTADGGLNLQQNGSSAIGAGVEYTYREILALRLGYRGGPAGTLNGLAGFSTGIGITVKPFELGYALTTLGDLGTAQEISLKSFY